MNTQLEAAMQLIKSKKTFESGISQLLDYIATKAAGAAACARQSEQQQQQHNPPAAADEEKRLMDAISRCMVLVKSRYSSTVYWKRVDDLVHAALPIIKKPEHQQALQTYARDIGVFLQDDTDGDVPTTQPTHNPFLFEGQLSEEPDHTRSGPGALYHLEQQLLRV